MALTCGNVRTGIARIGQNFPLLPPQVPQALLFKQGVVFGS